MILLFSSSGKPPDGICDANASSSQCSGDLSCGFNNKCECPSHSTLIGVDECSKKCNSTLDCNITRASCTNGTCKCDSASEFHNETTKSCEKSKYC